MAKSSGEQSQLQSKINEMATSMDDMVNQHVMVCDVTICNGDVIIESERSLFLGDGGSNEPEHRVSVPAHIRGRHLI